MLKSYLRNGGSKEDWLNPDNNFLHTPIFSLPLPEKYTLSPGAHQGREESHKAGILWSSKTSCSFFLSGGCIFIITNLLETGMVTQTKSAENCHGIQGLTSSLSPNKGEPWWGGLSDFYITRSSPIDSWGKDWVTDVESSAEGLTQGRRGKSLNGLALPVTDNDPAVPLWPPGQGSLCPW